MPRQRYTLGQLKARLRERAGNNETFWTEPELKDALNEAISVWQALTGEWTTRVRITAQSNSPSFYPVPKNIVSLTRVGTGSISELENPLGGTIMLSYPALETQFPGYGDNWVHAPWSVPIQMIFYANGGVPPYEVVWSYEFFQNAISLGTAAGPTNTGGPFEFTFEPPSGTVLTDETECIITATVTDSAGDVFVCTRSLWLIIAAIWVSINNELYTPVP